MAKTHTESKQSRLRRHILTPSERPPPWSPLSVAVIAFVLPPGGAALTVRNLARLGALDKRSAAYLTAGVVVLMAVAYGLILVLTKGNPSNLDGNAQLVLTVGTSLAAYIAQRNAFRQWRERHPRVRTSPWILALGVAVGYCLIIVLTATVLLMVSLGLSLAANGF